MKQIHQHYQISESGELFSNGRIVYRDTKFRNGESVRQQVVIRPKKLKPYKAKNGYLVHNIVGDVKYVHHMVYEAYIGNRTPGMTINHKDGDRLNNHVSNLEEVTYARNNEHARELGLNRVVISEHSKRVPVLAFKDGQFVGMFESATLAEKHTGACHVTCICKGKRRSSNGYVFKYAEATNHKPHQW